jgi:hypothetical protein
MSSSRSPNGPIKATVDSAVFTLAKAIGKPLPGNGGSTSGTDSPFGSFPLFSSVVPVGGFLNLSLDKAAVAQAFSAISPKRKSGREPEKDADSVLRPRGGANRRDRLFLSQYRQTVSVGHLRSTIIGQAIGNRSQNADTGWFAITIWAIGELNSVRSSMPTNISETKKRFRRPHQRIGQIVCRIP